MILVFPGGKNKPEVGGGTAWISFSWVGRCVYTVAASYMYTVAVVNMDTVDVWVDHGQFLGTGCG